MSAAKKTKIPAEIREETAEQMEQLAHDFFKQLLDVAFQNDGFRGVMHASVAMLKEADKFAIECESQKLSERMTRAVVCSNIGATWAPGMIAEISKHTKAKTA